VVVCLFSVYVTCDCSIRVTTVLELIVTPCPLVDVFLNIRKIESFMSAFWLRGVRLLYLKARTRAIKRLFELLPL